MTNFSCPGFVIGRSAMCFFVGAVLLSSQPMRSDIHDRIEYKLNRVLKDIDIIINNETNSCSATVITQADIDAQDGTYTILKSGQYCLSENVVGVFVIDGLDCVCLNLNCHEVDAGGNQNAVIIENSSGVTVFNGCIKHASDAGILITGSSSVGCSDLHFSDNALDGIRIDDSNAVKVDSTDFLGEVGERAIRCLNSKNVNISTSSIVNFTSTIGALLEFSNCQSVNMTDLDVSNNIKSITAANTPFSANSRFVSVDSCDTVKLRYVNVNDNTIANDVPGHKEFQAIGVAGSSSVVLSHCEACLNEDLVGGTATDNQIFIGNSEDVIIAGSQVNGNTCTGAAIDSFFGVHLLNSSAVVMGDSRVNTNSVAALTVRPSASSIIGIFNESPNGDLIMTRVEANQNSCSNGGVRGLGDGEGFTAGIVAYGKAFIEKSQANENAMETSGSGTRVYGVRFEFSLDVSVSVSYFEDNTGGEFAAGIFLVPTEGDDAAIRSIIKSSASFNNGYGILSIPLSAAPAELKNVTIVSATLSQNYHDTLEAAGVFIDVPGADNVYIRSCDINGNHSVGNSAYGIFITGASNVEVSGSHILNTSSDSSSAHGILFDTILGGEIFSTQSDFNKSSGVELVGSNTGIVLLQCLAQDNDKGFTFAQTSTASCCLVQDCRALGNTTFGFEHATAPLTTTFVGNQAQCNGSIEDDNYAINGGIINLQQLSWSTGNFTVVTGTDERSRWSNIVAVS